LEQIIALTEGLAYFDFLLIIKSKKVFNFFNYSSVDLIAIKKERLLSELNLENYDINNEESLIEPKPSTSSSDDNIVSDEKTLIESLNELNGFECKAPFVHQNGMLYVMSCPHYNYHSLSPYHRIN
jgi:hypothetical protein